MTSIDLRLDAVPTPSTSTATTPATTAPARGTGDYLAVTMAWVVAVVAAAVFPLEDPQVSRAALFIHLVSMAIGFGAVIMIDVYGLLWLFGHRTLVELVDLDTAAPTAIPLAIG